MKKKASEIPVSVSSETEKMVKLIKEQFSEIFLATTYATKQDRKRALYNCLEEGVDYTVKELQNEFMRRYSIPISRVAINTYVNELEAEGKVVFTRQGLGGLKIIRLSE